MLVLDFSASERPTPQIVQRGVRNPWRFSFDRETNDLWIGDVGQNAWEEIDHVPLAEASRVNWGWRRWEGNHAYPSGSNPSRKGMRFPITEYGRDRGGSVTGGYVYRGSAYPALVGTYLFADFSGGWIAGLQRLDEAGATLAEPRERVLVESAGNPASFGEDENGELYVCDLGGTLYRVTATAK
jgi:glucose/arabinose dehydrogenase